MVAHFEHYYTKNPKSEYREHSFETILRGNKLKLLSASGVFSKKEVDKGTRLLIEKSIIEDKSMEMPEHKCTLLDLGCGYGAVGVAMKKSFPKIEVMSSDINRRAVSLTKKNAALNKIRLKAIVSDGFEKINHKFDIILLNPPQSSGRDICIRLIGGAFKHLNHKGIFEMVARPRKGGKTLALEMERIFGNVKVVARNAGFAVYLSKHIANKQTSS